MRESRRRAVLAGRVAVALTVATLGIVGVYRAVNVTASQAELLASAPSDTQHQQDYDLFTCLERQFHAQIPSGSRVFIAPSSALFEQRMAEFSSGWAIPVARRAEAAYAVDAAPSNPGCPPHMGFRVLAP